MPDDVYISIVDQQGSRESKWSGFFKFDPIHGYSGRLLSSTFDFKAGANPFDTPPELDKEALYCIVDGSNFATIIWPDFSGGAQIKNFAARLHELEIRNLIRGVHIGATEQDITAVRLYSPIFAQLFQLDAFESKIETNPYKVTITSLISEDREFKFSTGKLLVGIHGTYSPMGTAPTVSARSYVTIQFGQKVTPTEALRVIRQAELFFSLITFSFIKADRVEFEIECRNKEGQIEKNNYDLERALLNDKAQTDIARHNIPIRIKSLDIGRHFEEFQKLFEPIEQTLNWYRIVTSEERYLDDKYFYCVRMIEALYRALNITTEGDKEAISLVDQISKALSQNEPKYEPLVKFLNTRVRSTFSRPSLASIITHVKSAYKEIRVVEILGAKKINSLRGKHAHGSTDRFSSKDYQFMYYAYEILLALYPIIVLENCGFDRDFIYAQLKNSFSYRRFFEESTLKEYQKNL